MNKLTSVGRPLVCLLLSLFFITKTVALNYYWVGGNGLWSEFATHWATSPAGTTFHANVPTAGDDVFFTNNGGAAYTVTVNSGSTVPKCRSMDWSAAPAGTVWAGGGGAIDIYGSVVLDANMSMNYLGEIHFRSTAGTNTVFSDGVHYICNAVFFDGTGGGWDLLDDFFVDANLRHGGGLLRTLGHKVTIGGGGNFYGNYYSGENGQLQLGSSEFVVQNGGAFFFYTNSQFNAETSHIKLFGTDISLWGRTYTADIHFHNVSFFASTAGGGGFAWGNVDGTLTFHQSGRIVSSFSTALINNAIFLGDGRIDNAVKYNHLTFTAGKTYIVGTHDGDINTDQTILPGGTLTALGLGTCSQFITIKSWQFGTHFNFVNNSGATQTVHCAIIEDCHATGSDPLEVIDGINLGNTTGWNFVNPNPGLNLYWVGGAGDWNDPCHWTSNPLSLVGDCTCIPNGGSNVFFTANSGFSAGDVVTVNADAYCANMDWTGVTGMPEFYHTSGGATNLHIYGSIKLASDMDFNFGGTVRFRTSNTATITSASQDFDYIVVLEGSGTWELQDTFKVVNHWLVHKRGTLKSLGKPMLVNQWFGNTDGNGNQFNMGAEVFLGGPSGSSNVFLVKSLSSGIKGHFRCYYQLNKFHAAQSHFIGLNGGYIDSYPAALHSFWNVTFNPIDHAGDFVHGNVLNKLTFLGGANLVSISSHIPGTPSNIHEAEFHQGGYIYGSNTFDILTMSGGYSYKFEHNNTVQTITAGGSFNQLNGSCTAPIYFYNPIPGNSTTFRKEGAGTNFNIHNAIFDRVNADQTTGANYVATNSFAVQPDVATSWNITNAAGRNLYWVGGNGNWNDPAHWSLVTNGTGGECPPTAQDNVFFNADSGLGGGQAVTLDGRFSFCKDMDWTGVASGTLFNSGPPPPDPYGGSGLMIFGSLAFSANMTNNVAGFTWLRADGPATIFSAGQTFKNDLLFWSGTGQWSLLDDLSTIPNSNVVIDHWYGELTTNNYNITCGGWGYTFYNAWYNLPQPFTAKINLGSSKLRVWAGNAYNSVAVFYNYAIGNFNVGTSEIILEDTGPNNNIQAGEGSPATPIQTFYDISIKGPGTLYGGQVDGKLLFKKTGSVTDGGRIKNLEFEGDGNFMAFTGYSRDVHSIKFAPGKRYTFTLNFTLNITPMGLMEGQFIAQGLPGQYIEIKSSNPAQQAIIHMDDLNGTSTCTKYLFLTGMAHTGTEDIYVPTPGGNVQNNTGWQFFPCNPCPASIPVLDLAASITSGCNPGQAKLVLDNLDTDEVAMWYTDPAATTNLIYDGRTAGMGGNMFMPTITGPTTYFARVWDDGALCESTVVLTVNIATVTPPTVFDVSGSITGCQGIWAPVHLSGSQVGVTYHLLRDGVEVHTILSGGTGPITFPSQTVSGMYTVVATLPTASCSATMNGSAVITLSGLTAPNVIASSNQPLCEGGGVDLMLTESGTGGTGWAWTGPAGFSSMDQNPVITNPTTANAGIYTVVVTGANGCTNTGFEQVFISPQPTVDPVANQVFCSDVATPVISFTGSPGASFTWTNSNPAIGLAASGSGSVPSFFPINNGATNITATITIQSQSIFCTGTSTTFTITVKPSPKVDISIGFQWYCGGCCHLTQPITFTSNIPGTTFSWTNPNPSIGLGLNGVGDIAAFMAYGFSPGGNFTNITVTPSDHNGCAGIPSSATIEIRPFPEMDFPADQSVCNGSPTTPVTFVSNTPGTTFQWTNNNPSIGLAASGTGNLPAFTAMNAGATPVTAHITINPVGPNGCYGQAAGFNITVKPSPVASAAPFAQSVCSSEPTAEVVLSSNVVNTSFAWTNSIPGNGLAASGTGNVPSFTPSNSSSVPMLIVLTVTPTADGCTGPSIMPIIEVYPIAGVNLPADQVVCRNTMTSAVQFTGSIPGATYQWTNDKPSIGLAASGTGDIPAFTGLNPGNTAPITATIVVTAIEPYGGCIGEQEVFHITVNPRPSVAAIDPQMGCNGTAVSVPVFTGFVAGTVFNWINDNPGIGLAASGTGNIPSFTAVNTGTTIVQAQVTTTPSYTNLGVTCTGNPMTFTIDVYPTPTVTNMNTEPTTCTATNGAIDITATGGGPFTYLWTGPGTVNFQQDQTGLGYGPYSLTVVNNGGCFAIMNYVLNGPGGCGACPTFGTLASAPASPVCQYSSVSLTAGGLTDMGSTFGIVFKYSPAALADPYLGGTVFATVPNLGLTGGGTTATATGSFPSGGSFWVYAILSPAPFDPACRPFRLINLIVTADPAAPMGNCMQSFCASDAPTVASLVPNGPGIFWYDMAAGGSPLAVGTPLVNGGNYYATQTVGGCESTTRLHVMAGVVTPAPGHVCIGGCSN